MPTNVTIQRTFACPHCGKPIDVDSVLDALSSAEILPLLSRLSSTELIPYLSQLSASDLARAMRDRRKRELTPEAASAMGKKSAAKRRGSRRQSEESGR